jgi:hypothetical protein
MSPQYGCWSLSGATKITLTKSNCRSRMRTSAAASLLSDIALSRSTSSGPRPWKRIQGTSSAYLPAFSCTRAATSGGCESANEPSTPTPPIITPSISNGGKNGGTSMMQELIPAVVSISPIVGARMLAEFVTGVLNGVPVLRTKSKTPCLPGFTPVIIDVHADIELVG